MASARSVKLAVDAIGTLTRIQLGAITQVRGIKEIGDIVFPRFTGVHIDDPKLELKLSPEQPAEFLLDNVSASISTLVFEDVTYLVDGFRTFPYSGVYRIRIRAAYQVDSFDPLQENGLFLSFITLNQGVQTNYELAVDLTTVRGVIEFEQLLICDSIAKLVIQNLSPTGVVILGVLQPFPARGIPGLTSLIEVEYIGTL